MALSDEDVQRIALAVWRVQINDGPTGAKANTGSVLGWTRSSAHAAKVAAQEAAANTRD